MKLKDIININKKLTDLVSRNVNLKMYIINVIIENIDLTNNIINLYNEKLNKEIEEHLKNCNEISEKISDIYNLKENDISKIVYEKYYEIDIDIKLNTLYYSNIENDLMDISTYEAIKDFILK